MHLAAANHFILDIPILEDFKAHHFKDAVDFLIGTLRMDEIDFPRYSHSQKRTYPDGSAFVAVTNNFGLLRIMKTWPEVNESSKYFDPKNNEWELPGEFLFFYRTRVCYIPSIYIGAPGSETHLLFMTKPSGLHTHYLPLTTIDER